MPRSKGRTGRPFRRVRADVLAASSICWLCGKPGATTVDHVLPVSKLPADHPLLRDPANLRPAHQSCNSSRGNRTTRGPQLSTSRQW